MSTTCALGASPWRRHRSRHTVPTSVVILMIFTRVSDPWGQKGHPTVPPYSGAGCNPPVRFSVSDSLGSVADARI